MRKRRRINNIKGFTLTELAVVIVLLSLISLLCVTIVLAVNSANNSAQLTSKQESEIIKLKSTFDDWILSNDSADYTLTVSKDKIEASDGNEVNSFTICQNLTLTVNGETQLSMSEIETVTFDIPFQNVIRLSVTFKNSKNQYKILYTTKATALVNGE